MDELDIIGSDGTQFEIRWDGWSGLLELYPTAWANASNKLSTGGRDYGLRYEIHHDAQGDVEGMTGPGYIGADTSHGHRIVMWVDFENGEKSQRFDGYLFNQTGADAMAGVTWWQGMPYGFYAVRRLRIPG
jgi:hypothetical protein